MNSDEQRGWAIIFVLLLLVLILAGCATLTKGSAAQRLYEAEAAYTAALGAAVDYAESPTAAPSIVRALNTARRAALPAQSYVRAFTLCRGKSSAEVVAGVNCALFDFRPGTLNSYAIQLRSGVTAMMVRR